VQLFAEIEWHWVFEIGNVLSLIGILISSIGVVISILYARSAKRVAFTALQAAAAARKELLIRIAAEEITQFIRRLQSLREANETQDLITVLRIAGELSIDLSAAETSWVELRELQHGEIAVITRQLKRILVFLRDDTLVDNEKVRRVSETLDFVSQLMGKVSGRLRFRS